MISMMKWAGAPTLSSSDISIEFVQFELVSSSPSVDAVFNLVYPCMLSCVTASVLLTRILANSSRDGSSGVRKCDPNDGNVS